MPPIRGRPSRSSWKPTTLLPDQLSSVETTPSFPYARTVSTVYADRAETDVLLAIQHEHLSNIIERKKNHEHRKYRLRNGAERLWFYETRGKGEGAAAITHIALISPNERRTPGNVPEVPFGVGNAEFNRGEKESKYGYPIMGLFELVQPITLAEMKSSWGIGAPMGWCFVKQPMWGSRWGISEVERKGYLKRIF